MRERERERERWFWREKVKEMCLKMEKLVKTKKFASAV